MVLFIFVKNYSNLVYYCVGFRFPVVFISNRKNIYKANVKNLLMSVNSLYIVNKQTRRPLFQLIKDQNVFLIHFLFHIWLSTKLTQKLINHTN